LITTWDDQIGSKDFTAPADGNRPTKVDNYYGTLPAVRFQPSQISYMESVFGENISQPHTLFLVMKIDAVAGGDTFFNSTTTTQTMFTHSGGQFGIYAGSGPTWTGEAPDFVSTHLYTFLFNGAASKWDIDNVNKNSGDYGTNVFHEGMTIGTTQNNTGGSQLMNGYIMEIVIYAGDWYSGGKKDTNAVGLMEKWGI